MSNETPAAGAFEGANRITDDRIYHEMKDQLARSSEGPIHVPAWDSKRVLTIMRELRDLKVNLIDDGK